MRFPDQLASLLVLAAGCSSLQPVSVAYITETRPALVHVSDGFGVVTTIANPTISGDSISGTVFGADRPVAVPLREAQRITTVRPNRARTIMLVSAIAVAGGLVTYTVLANTNGDDSGFCDYDNQPAPGQGECGYPSNP